MHPSILQILWVNLLFLFALQLSSYNWINRYQFNWILKLMSVLRVFVYMLGGIIQSRDIHQIWGKISKHIYKKNNITSYNISLLPTVSSMRGSTTQNRLIFQFCSFYDNCMCVKTCVKISDKSDKKWSYSLYKLSSCVTRGAYKSAIPLSQSYRLQGAVGVG